MTDHPTEAEFRAAGFTADAVNYPLSDAAVAWLCQFNGAPNGWTPPRAWRYAPNPAMQATLERNAAAQSGVTLGEVPLSTGTGQGKAPEISDGLGTVPQQTHARRSRHWKHTARQSQPPGTAAMSCRVAILQPLTDSEPI
jgi:hypothetical protein